MLNQTVSLMLGSHRRIGVLLALVAIVAAEQESAHAPNQRKRRDAMDLTALPEAPDRDDAQVARKSELGRMLFFDPRLSGNNSISCATCHIPDQAFADGKPVGRGRDGMRLARNTPTVLNVAFLSSFFWDGRAASLEEQALGPIQAADEMHQDLEELEAELQSVPGYAEQFRELFGGPVSRKAIAESLAAFERTLIGRNSPVDRYLNGDKEALSDEALRGLELFRSEAGCIRCHHGPLLSDGRFYRLGVDFSDRGRGAFTAVADDVARFRTPSLRDVARTAPYMHNGSLKTLFEVVEFYYRSVPQHGPDGLSVDVEPLSGRSYSEIPDIVAFLESLNGDPPTVAVPELP